MIVPVRELPVLFAVAENATLPVPVPAPGEVVSHGAVVVAVQLQSVLTETEPEPPSAGILEDWEPKRKSHIPALWVTVKSCPAIVRDPVRPTADVFRAMVKPVDPFPVPLCPKETVIQEALLVVVQAQLLGEELIATSPFPPKAFAVKLFGDME